jgi:flagellar hook-basal body complex protein FliE
MALESLGALPPLVTLPRTTPSDAAGSSSVMPPSGFAQILGGIVKQNVQASQAANHAIHSLATGEAQDLHTVSLAVAQADLSFRLILEMRNRLSEAYQEIARMQV